MNRRGFLKGSAGAIAAATAGFRIPDLMAQAKPETMSLMTWGGLWGNAMAENVDAAFEKATGVRIVQDRGSSPVERVTKLKVHLNDQIFDLVQLHDGVFPLAVRQGVVEPIDINSPRMPNLRNVPKRFVRPNWVVMIYSALGVTYNREKVKNPPTGYADLWRPEFKGRIVLPDINHSIGPYIVPIGAMAQGKDLKDEETGFEMLKKMTDLDPIWAKDTDSIMSALVNEEALIGLLYKSQTFTVQDKGAKVNWVFPKEGAIAYLSGTGIAKNTKNKELAEQYINLTADPDVQQFVARKFNYPGTNPAMIDRLPPELQQRVRFSKEELDKIIDLDQNFMSDRRADWTDRWNRIVAGG